MAESFHNNGRRRKRPWTAQEEAIVRQSFPAGGYSLVLAQLHQAGFGPRTPVAVMARAYRLGVRRNGPVTRGTRHDVLHTTPPPRSGPPPRSDAGVGRVPPAGLPDGDNDRIRELKTDELFRVARGTRVAMTEALRDLNGFLERYEQVLSEILHRIERAGSHCGTGFPAGRSTEVPP